MKHTIRSPDRKSYMSVLFLLSLLMAACGPEPAPTSPPPTEIAQVATGTPILPTHTPVPPDTLAPATDTAMPKPSATAPLATPSPSADPTGAYEAKDEHVEESDGLSFVVPAGWEAMIWQGGTYIMASGDAHSFPEQTPEVFALVITSWLFDLVDIGADVESLEDPIDLLAVSHSLQWLGESLQRSTGSEELKQIGGYPAYAVATKDEKGRHEYVVLVLAQDIGRVAILEGISSPKRWEDVLPTFEAIASSLTLSELQIEKVDPTLDELEIPTTEDLGSGPFVSEEHAFQIAYPEGWLVLDDMTQVSFSPDAAHSLCDEMSGIEWDECHTPVAVAVRILDSDSMEGVDVTGSQSDSLYLLELLAMGQTPGPTYVFRTLETFDVNGVPAMGARFYGNDYAHDEYQSFRGFVAIVRGDTQGALVWTTAPTAVWQQFRPVFGAMLDSFAFVGD